VGRLLAWLRSVFWLVVGPPPLPAGTVDANALAERLNAAMARGALPPQSVRVVVSPRDLMVEAERLREVAREYERRTGRRLFWEMLR